MMKTRPAAAHAYEVRSFRSKPSLVNCWAPVASATDGFFPAQIAVLRVVIVDSFIITRRHVLSSPHQRRNKRATVLRPCGGRWRHPACDFTAT
jgi:hypothetical protein